MFHSFPSPRTIPVTEGGTGIGNPGPLLLGKIIGHGALKMTAVQVNYTAVAAPLATDDDTKGYAVGSEWMFGGSFYFCVNASTGGAVWVLIGAAGTLNGFTGRLTANTSSMTTTLANTNVGASNAVIATVESPVGVIYDITSTNRTPGTSIDFQLSSVPIAGTYINWLVAV